MIQIIIRNESEKYSVAELVQMAVEGGCRWIRLDLPEADEAFMLELGNEIVPLCRDAAVMLTIDNRPDIARKLGLHGVHISDKSLNPVALREELGPEAVIGVTVSDPGTALAMAKADIDYVQLPGDFDADSIAAFMVDLREINKNYPVVAEGDAYAGCIGSLLALGVSGTAIGAPVYMADDPVAATANLLKQLD
ncbi:MAG: thiamine phosphate synthase [Muribaculaceae bacterium]|nr:thiamine phosphate synthase [Muribaculaceae bacterium]